MPTTMGIFVLSVAAQMLAGRERFWLPNWILRRTLARGKLCKALEWLHRPARFIDRWLHPRLTLVLTRPGKYLIAFTCTLIGLSMLRRGQYVGAEHYDSPPEARHPPA